MPPGGFANPLTERLVAFERITGIEVRAATLLHQTDLAEREIRDGAIAVDEMRPYYPGDVLHETGHLAVADPAERDRCCYATSCKPRMPAKEGVTPFSHTSRWLR
jgi:hypothetical protein